MATIESGRMTHAYDGELVVFLIGMRINSWWRPDLWLPVFTAMPPMLAELSKDPASGLLGYRLVLGEGGPMVVMYWDSHEKLYAYASDPAATHRPAWGRFNQRARKAPGAVASGTRPSRSARPSRSTPACPSVDWRRRPTRCRWDGGRSGRRSGSGPAGRRSRRDGWTRAWLNRSGGGDTPTPVH